MQRYLFSSFLVSLFLIGTIALAGCGGGTVSTSGTTSTTGSTTSNVMAISVNGGPTVNLPGGGIYPNGAFASATICAPGSTTDCALPN